MLERVSHAPRLRPHASPARAGRRRRPGDRGHPPRLGPDADRTARTSASSRRCTPGRSSTARCLRSQTYGIPPVTLSSNRYADLPEGEGKATMHVARILGHALGLLGRATLRQTGHLVGDLDLAALARISRHAARHEGRSRPAFPAGHQPAHRPRLALLAADRRRARDGACTPPARFNAAQSVVDRDARHDAIPAARQLRAAPGQAGQRRRAAAAK